MILAGIAGGSFTVPMRYMPKWAWENYWTIYALVALVIVPWSLAGLTAHSLASVYSASGPRVLLSTALFGFLWGIAGFMFGLSVEMVGMSLTFAVVNGLGTAVGTWIPLAVLHFEDLLTPGGIILSGGVCAVIGGVAVCSWAGNLRNREAQEAPGPAHHAGQKAKFRTGLMIAIASGVLGPCLNLGIAFSGKISSASVAQGSAPLAANNAVLAILFSGGFISNIAYCLLRFRRNRSFDLFKIPERTKYVFFATLMGLLWITTYTVYGLSAAFLKSYVAVVGWPILMAAITITSSLWDIAFGEWSKRSLRVMGLGVTLLIASVAVVSYGSSRLSHP